MENNNNSIHDFDFSFICDFFKRMERQGPGSVDATKKALSFIPDLPVNALIADLGCGTGGQTIDLARNVKGYITALDLFPEFIEILEEKVKSENLTDRINPVIGSMDNLPFHENELDLIWSEGAIYNIGFENGLKYWNKFLKPEGYIAVSEVSWFTSERPKEIEDFWLDAYSEIDTIPVKVQKMQEAGYIPLAHFILPVECWTKHFYSFMDKAIKSFLEKYAYSDKAVAFVKNEQREMELYLKYKKYYGYVFYIGQKK